MAHICEQLNLLYPQESLSLDGYGGPVTSPGRCNGRVLYIDDDEALIFLATRALAKLEFQIAGYTDPAAAVAYFTAHADEFDVVVTDITMTNMSGAEVSRHIRAIRPDMPIIMMSGCLRPEDHKTARQLQINRLVCKPGTMAELATILSAEVGKAKSSSGTVCDDVQ